MHVYPGVKLVLLVVQPGINDIILVVASEVVQSTTERVVAGVWGHSSAPSWGPGVEPRAGG